MNVLKHRPDCDQTLQILELEKGEDGSERGSATKTLFGEGSKKAVRMSLSSIHFAKETPRSAVVGPGYPKSMYFLGSTATLLILTS